MYDFLIVGAGLAGSVMAERLASAGKTVLIIDRRNHIGGNAYDYYNAEGILVHKYGAHIFHTNSKEVFEYLSLFTAWRPYEHRTLASVDGQLLPLPINRTTINKLYGLNLTNDEVVKFFKSVAQIGSIDNAEHAVINRIGRHLYEKFFKNYTKKQWGLEAFNLDASVTNRIPVRMNNDDRYFEDTYQAMPKEGYTAMISKMLQHKNINILLQADYHKVVEIPCHNQTIYTGPIDEYFSYSEGRLPYRSLIFEHETLCLERYQPAGIVNYPNNHLYTRVTEFKHLTGQVHPKTTIAFEYPTGQGEPFYPIPAKENALLYDRYKKLSEDLAPVVRFTGRLGSYRYYNMDQVVAQSLTLFKTIRNDSTEHIKA